MKSKAKFVLWATGFLFLLPVVFTGVVGAADLGVHHMIGCTGCHHVQEGPLIDDTQCTACHTKPLTQMNHLTTRGTPAGIAMAEGNEAKACKICHMPEKIHLWVIGTDPAYTTFPTEVHDVYTEDDLIDIDLSCGQCHGGGDNEMDNPPQPGVPYRSKENLAVVAEGMHASAGVSYPVTFTASVTPNTLDVYVEASVNCGDTCPPLFYDWDWGDEQPHGTGNPATHTYDLAGVKNIKLTVSIASGIVGSVTRSITIENPDLAPVANATCVWNANTWIMDVTDRSIDDGPDGDADEDTPPELTISVDWSDGSVKSYGAAGDGFSHAYTKTGSFGISLKAVDRKLQSNTYTCTTNATPEYFSISGNVIKSVAKGGGALSATVQLLNNANAVITSVTSSSTTGEFSFTSRKPGIYKIKVKKTGYTFPDPMMVVIGPSSTGNTIQALTP